MLGQIATEYQNVVKVYCNEFVQIVREDLVHQLLERGWCVAQPKQHDKKLKVASVNMKSCLLYRRLFHHNLVVARCEVQLCKNLGLAQRLQQRINVRQWELIPHSLFVEGLVINAHTPPAVFFGDK